MNPYCRLNDFIMSQTSPPLILCIGSARVSGDSFGPMTGQILNEFLHCPANIYGTMRRPIHAVNLASSLSEIKFLYPDRKILAVDAAIGGNPGEIRVFPGPLRPGLAGGKRLAPVGDYCVTASICDGNVDELYKVSKSDVLSLAARAALIINAAFGSGKCRFAENLRHAEQIPI